MKIVMFDLGDTLEHQDVLLPGAIKTLRAVRAMTDSRGSKPVMALGSDFDMPNSPSEIPAIRQQYYQILSQLRIRTFFEPVDQRVTLSTEVGVFKPHKKFFKTALNKLDGSLPFSSVLFITENLVHVQAARGLGLRAIHFKGPGQTTGDVARLVDLIPHIQTFVGAAARVARRKITGR